MRKVVLFVATSLDGFIARSDGGIDWLFTDGDYGYGEFLASIDTALIGRRTYDSMVAMGESSVTGKRTLVVRFFLLTAQHRPTHNTVHAGFVLHGNRLCCNDAYDAPCP